MEEAFVDVIPRIESSCLNLVSGRKVEVSSDDQALRLTMLMTKLALAPRRRIWRVAVSASPIEGDVCKQRGRDRYC